MTWRPRSTNPFLRLLMLAAVILMAAFITQCRMVTDELVRPEASAFGPANDCTRACIEAAKEAKEAENERHRDAVEACRGGHDDDDDDDDATATNTYRNGNPDKDKGKGDKDDRDKRDRPDAGKDDKDKKGQSACLKAEEARHEAALKAIEKQRRDCVNGCHHQGGGSGGG